MSKAKIKFRKNNRFKIGDEVTWSGGPNELSHFRYGKIISIKHGIATINDIRNAEKTRKIPINILQKKS